METSGFIRYRKYLIAILLVVMAIFAIWVRMLPSAAAGTTDILNLVGSDDPMYNLRQVEQMNQNFPAYGWFEAMTLYPYGRSSTGDPSSSGLFQPSASSWVQSPGRRS